jgi:hypothetical protein
MGEVAAFARVLAHTGILTQIQEQVRFARARFGQYELIDFVAVLLGYMLSGEPTLLAFYERLTPWADAFMALDAAQPLASSLHPVSVSLCSRSSECGGAPDAMRKKMCWLANRFLPPAACLIEPISSGS